MRNYFWLPIVLPKRGEGAACGRSRMVEVPHFATGNGRGSHIWALRACQVQGATVKKGRYILVLSPVLHRLFHTHTSLTRPIQLAKSKGNFALQFSHLFMFSFLLLFFSLSHVFFWFPYPVTFRQRDICNGFWSGGSLVSIQMTRYPKQGRAVCVMLGCVRHRSYGQAKDKVCIRVIHYIFIVYPTTMFLCRAVVYIYLKVLMYIVSLSFVYIYIMSSFYMSTSITMSMFFFLVYLSALSLLSPPFRFKETIRPSRISTRVECRL